MKNLLTLWFSIIVFIFGTSETFGQLTWTKDARNPVLSGGASGEWNRHVMTPFVLYNGDSARYEMWFTASDAIASDWRPYRIGFAISKDGVSWMMHPSAVLAPSPGTWDAYTVQYPSVVRENGQYKMWYTGKDASGSPTSIGYATSPDGIQWTKYAGNPVMGAGTAAWEAGGPWTLHVLPFSGGYKMWYDAATATASSVKIGIAVSSDGISWKRDTVNNPIVQTGASGEWDAAYVMCPKVVNIGKTWYMVYSAGESGVNPSRVGVAMSNDSGKTWQKYSSNPILLPSKSGWDATYVNNGSVILRGDTLHMWYVGALSPASSNLYRIGYATSPHLSKLIGTYTVGKTGYFPSLDSAFARLSRDGILGPVTLSLIDTLYDATTNANGTFKLVGPIAGAGPSSRLTIRPAENEAVTIQGNGDATLMLENVSYCTIDGVSLTGNTRLKVHALYKAEYAYNEGLLFTANSDFNIIQNISAATDDITRISGAVGLWGKAGAASDSCLITNVQVTSGGMGIYIAGSATLKSMGNVMRNNHVGSPKDSLIAFGIHNQQTDGTIIENNHVQNLRLTLLSVLNIQLGINTFGSNNTIIRNNIIHNLRINGIDTKISGIIASGGTSYRGSNVWIYNNKIWDISNSGTTNAELDGITAWYQDSLKVDHNTVYLSEMSDIPPTVGSSAIYLPSTNTTPVIRNNILVNTRDDSPYSSVAIKMEASKSQPDYNDLFVGSASSANIAMLNSTPYKTLADWQGASKDVHSVSISPLFCTQALHIDTTKSILNDLEGKGTPIPGILTDFEGQKRSTTTPDIGADEFEKIPVQWQFKKYAGNPVLTRGAAGFDAVYVGTPSVLYVNKIFHMWYWAIDGTNSSVGYATSPDGINWTKYAGNPVLTADKNPDAFDGKEIRFLRVHYDGTRFHMMYTGINSSLIRRIGYAHSLDGKQWTKNPTAVFDVGTSGTWDAGGVIPGDFMKVGSKWHLWYGGMSSTGITRVGYASANDSVNWTRHPSMSPIMENGAAGQWDASQQIPVCVRKVGNDFHMWYMNSPSIGYAISSDGITWIKSPNNPILSPTPGTWDQVNIFHAWMVSVGKVHYLYYTGVSNAAANSEIGLAIDSTTAFPDTTSENPDTGIRDDVEIPQVFSLSQNYPNPFNPSTTIRYALPSSGNVKLTIHDLLGREIAVLVNEEQSMGWKEIEWRANGTASGIYFYRLKAGNFVETKKMILLK